MIDAAKLNSIVRETIREFPTHTLDGRPSTAHDVKEALAGRVDRLCRHLGGRAEDIPLSELHKTLDKIEAAGVETIEELVMKERAAAAKTGG